MPFDNITKLRSIYELADKLATRLISGLLIGIDQNECDNNGPFGS